MAESSSYNTETMRLLMTAALGVDLDQTTGTEAEVSCPSLSVTATCDEAGAQELVGRANQRMSQADVTYSTALAERDVTYEQVLRAQSIAAQMAAAEANALASPPAEES